MTIYYKNEITLYRRATWTRTYNASIKCARFILVNIFECRLHFSLVIWTAANEVNLLEAERHVTSDDTGLLDLTYSMGYTTVHVRLAFVALHLCWGLFFSHLPSHPSSRPSIRPICLRLNPPSSLVLKATGPKTPAPPTPPLFLLSPVPFNWNTTRQSEKWTQTGRCCIMDQLTVWNSLGFLRLKEKRERKKQKKQHEFTPEETQKLKSGVSEFADPVLLWPSACSHLWFFLFSDTVVTIPFYLPGFSGKKTILLETCCLVSVTKTNNVPCDYTKTGSTKKKISITSAETSPTHSSNGGGGECCCQGSVAP